MDLSGVMYACKLKTTTSSTFFQYSAYNPNTVVPAMH
jgi:hypothetical protein